MLLTLHQMEQEGYDITVSSSPEDTASCSGGGSGTTASLDNTACDASNGIISLIT
jgi:hypothetical protein